MYTRSYQGAIWPKGASGITVGIGYDVGYVIKASPGSPYARAFVESFSEYKSQSLDRFGKFLQRRVAAMVAPKRQQPMSQDQTGGEDWCFGGCTSQRVNVTVQPSKGSLSQVISGSSKQAVAAAEALSQPADAPLNAIFLAKKSAAGCSVGTTSNNYPFGCKLAKDLVRANGVWTKFIGQPLIAETNLYVRKRVPIPNNAGQAQFSCAVGEVNSNDEVRVQSIVAIAYLQDVAYWGLLPPPPQTTCR